MYLINSKSLAPHWMPICNINIRIFYGILKRHFISKDIVAPLQGILISHNIALFCNYFVKLRNFMISFFEVTNETT